MTTIAGTDSNFEREPLETPLGFKGRVLSELWQTAVSLTDAGGRSGLGLGTQSVLWSDAAVFARYSEAAGNGLMFLLTAHALRCCEGRKFLTPATLLEEILPEVMAYGRTISGRTLRPTFALNALVAVDNAAWQLQAAGRSGVAFPDLLPPELLPALSHRHRQLGVIPLISYNITPEATRELARQGHFVLKIKIGNDPERDGDRDKMLRWDCERLTQLHTALRDCTTPYTQQGNLAYYLDANGRYDSLDRVQRLLDHCDRIGALPQVLLLEEPFPEESEIDVRNLPVRIAADESAHSVADVEARIEAGYGAIALKPIAKTMSLSLRMAAAAQARGVPCFCADLTVNPVLVDWNKNVAARLAPLPGLKIGVLESNGAQHYRDWARMRSYHPDPAAGWIDPQAGLFLLDERFYATSGGIFQPSPHYTSLLA